VRRALIGGSLAVSQHFYVLDGTNKIKEMKDTTTILVINWYLMVRGRAG